eukprot:CAMPEP_0179108154 /NCGR_PEP_ID=MMETSP0796-20121207/50367_1 /TAXON_ID=73915 /ORGANISM="Pyrodinium bahamense, Strain pbaha01" /LENGTH=50 /DNA_ID=CAMNT_0020806223 /DNA_START=93 /DNA_END=242 /DNA_ORIENTATION=+
MWPQAGARQDAMQPGGRAPTRIVKVAATLSPMASASSLANAGAHSEGMGS